MLLPTMTYKEMYDHLSEDLEKIKIREENLRTKAIKQFRKESLFPAWRWYEYIVPKSKNKYIIFFYAESRYFIDNPKVDHFCVVHDNEYNKYIVKSAARVYKHTIDSQMMLIREIQVYTSHFLNRYKERGLKNMSLSTNDIACRYLSRNKKGVPIIMNEKINRHLEKYGPGAKYGFRVRDGFCFAMLDIQVVKSNDSVQSKNKPEALYIVYKTFMNESDMKENQISAIAQEHIAALQQYTNDFNKEAINGKINLTLEK